LTSEEEGKIMQWRGDTESGEARALDLAKLGDRQLERATDVLKGLLVYQQFEKPDAPPAAPPAPATTPAGGTKPAAAPKAAPAPKPKPAPLPTKIPPATPTPSAPTPAPATGPTPAAPPTKP
ncbi:MAG TPA: hypothetical protein VLE43_21575, partial [Candidatus Saccharimonadia bacterium]|nr:hypothetical protein [Candidatus Saccharimonadia bacterium]